MSELSGGALKGPTTGTTQTTLVLANPGRRVQKNWDSSMLSFLVHSWNLTMLIAGWHSCRWVQFWTRLPESEVTKECNPW